MSNQSTRSVFIDYLAFSAPISVMKDVHTFQEKGFEWRKFQYLPSYRHYQTEPRYACLPEFQGIPEIPSNTMTDEQLNQYDTDLIECYFSRLKTWIASVFGLVMGLPRGKGGFAYSDSALLYSDQGGSDHCGVIFWGGNNDTFYVQISGLGCAHVFSGTTPQKIHKWLKHLDIFTLKRLDLATDDYDGIFTCQAALRDYRFDAFYGGAGPKPKLDTSNGIDANGCVTKEIVNIGSRQSRIYWRIYNKALEQKVSGIWYRSEVELKGLSIDTLLNIAGIYTGLCDYSAQINPTVPTSIPPLFVRKAIDSIEAKVRWLRKQASATLAKVFHYHEGDMLKVFSMVLREEHLEDLNVRFDIPPIYHTLYQTLMSEKLKLSQTPF